MRTFVETLTEMFPFNTLLTNVKDFVTNFTLLTHRQRVLHKFQLISYQQSFSRLTKQS